MRTFFAVPIEERLKSHYGGLIDGLKRKCSTEKIHWVKPQNLHLSLRFLGETQNEVVEVIFDRLQQEMLSIRPFSLSLTKFIFFPSQEHPRVIAVGAPLTEELEKLYKLVNELTVELGFKPESRAFVPHMTLGRIQTPLVLPFGELEIETKTMFVNKVMFYESQTLPDGPVYSSLRELTLDRRGIER